MDTPLARESALRCPKCGGNMRCYDSRPGASNTIRRRRGCMDKACGHRFTTYEVAVENLPLSPVAVEFLLRELRMAHAALGERIDAIDAANKASMLIHTIDGSL